MLILCDYDACYHSFYEFSPLVCHFTKVHIYVLFRVNYVLYEGLIFSRLNNLLLKELFDLFPIND